MAVVENSARFVPSYEKLDLTPYLEKEALSEEDYELLYHQTGLTRLGVDALEDRSELLDYQENFFFEGVRAHSMAAVTTPRCVLQTEEGADFYAKLVPLQEGDILVTSTCHTFGWRNGHAAIVVDAESRRVLEAMTGRPVSVVLDPTLLLPPAAWSDVEQSMPLPPGGYVVSYFLSTDRFPEAFIRALAAREGLPVVNVQTNYSHIHMPGADNRADLGPGEFLHLLRHATYVCTNSFHCCIFSHRFGREYYVFSRFAPDDPANQNTRIETLLEIFGERHRWVADGQTPPPPAPSASQEEELRQKSLDYLRQALRD